MEYSDAYCIIEALMEKGLVKFQHPGFREWLDRLQSSGQMTEEERQALLQLACQLKINNLPIGEEVVTALN